MATAAKKSRKPTKPRDVRATFLVTAERRDALAAHTLETGVTTSHVVRGLQGRWMAENRK